jgi:sn1-specific diacylglycerol lipase
MLYVPELIWAILGAIWVSDDSRGCEPAEVGAVIAAVVARWVGRMLFPVRILWYEFGDFHEI